MATAQRSGIAFEAARIIVDEQVTDYRLAKQKAAERLGLGARAKLPENAVVQQAVIEYQRLFGGPAYAEHLDKLRRTALRAMALLAEFAPRLVGAAVSGAATSAHRVQLHAFADKPETLDIFLHDHGIEFAQDERSYRYPDGSEERIPLVRFEADGVGVDVAVFGTDDRRVPLNPADGHAYKRLDRKAAEKLLAA